MLRTPLAAAAAVACVGLAACAGPGHGAGSGATSGTSASRLLTDRANGRTVVARVGETITVKLSTTNWTFGAVSNVKVLGQGKQHVTYGRVGCRSLRDCGSVEVQLRATASGRATVRATREKCGELVRCTGAAGVYQVIVVVRS